MKITIDTVFNKLIPIIITCSIVAIFGWVVIDGVESARQDRLDERNMERICDPGHKLGAIKNPDDFGILVICSDPETTFKVKSYDKFAK